MNPKPPPTLTQKLERFRREARRGVHDTGRYRCPYFTWGKGPPVVFLHGLGDVALSFAPLISSLAEQFSCIAYDLPTGRGDGARLRLYTHADLVADLFSLLDHLEAEQSYVLGASFGSTIALAAALAKPERLPRVVLQGGFARRSLSWAEVLTARLARHIQISSQRLPGREAVLRRLAYEPFASRAAEDWQFFLANTGANPLAALAHRALLVHQLDLRPRLAEIRQPVLLVCGERDPIITAACEEELLQGLPNVGRVQLENCGHFAYFSHPEALAEVVRQFLTPPVCGQELSCQETRRL